MIELRSLSKFGLSQIRMTFEDGVDLYRTRQLAGERLLVAAETLPAGLQPRIAPMGTDWVRSIANCADFVANATNKPKTRLEQLMS